MDVALNSTLPRRPILSSFVTRLKTKIPNVHFGTNPCRIKFFDQEIVVFRDDSMSKMLRNVVGVGVKPDVSSDDLKRFVGPSLFIANSYPNSIIACAIHSRSSTFKPADYKHPTCFV